MLFAVAVVGDERVEAIVAHRKEPVCSAVVGLPLQNKLKLAAEQAPPGAPQPAALFLLHVPVPVPLYMPVPTVWPEDHWYAPVVADSVSQYMLAAEIVMGVPAVAAKQALVHDVCVGMGRP